MDQVFKNEGLTTALEIIILCLDAKSIASCTLVSTYLKNFIDGRKSLINRQLYQILPNLKVKQKYFEMGFVNNFEIPAPIYWPDPLTSQSGWKTILDHV